ncbi:MAG: DNA methyltransferase [Syntrophales bacterium]|nr:DNA methyltransferase [Syntrophales bacterium]
MKPIYDHAGISIFCGHAPEVLKNMEAESIQLCVTSPPYWGLRDYDLPPVIWDAKEGCVHEWIDNTYVRNTDLTAGIKQKTNVGAIGRDEPVNNSFCHLCGAWLGCLGLEPTPELYVKHLVQIFREVRRVLKKDGTLFLNLGDSYFGSGGAHTPDHANPGLSKSASRGGVQRVNAYDTSDKEPEDYQGRDSLCESLCDVCRKAYLIGKSRNGDLPVPMQALLPSETNHEHKELQTDRFPTSGSLILAAHTLNAIPDSANLKDHEDEQPLSFQESMTGLSFVQHQDLCLQKDNHASCPLCGQTSTPCVRGYGCRQDCTFGTDSPSGASILDRLDKSSSYLAYPNLTTPSRNVKLNLKPKDLIGIPWRVAFALQADGWWLRADIIWAKPNPMPESVTDRPTKSHEYIFLMSKNGKYFYDAEAIKEELQESSIKRNQSGWNGNQERGYVNGTQNHMSKYLGSDKAKQETHRNKRSVWTVATKPYKEAHFAVFPAALITPCIEAGSKIGDTVLDPFGGSMTTAYVAKKLNRNAVMIELNEKYIKMGIKRLSQEVLQF